MGAGEREFHLRLDPGDLRDAKSRRLPSRIVQKRRLPDARLATQHKGSALPFANLRKQSVEVFALAGPVEETETPIGGHCTATVHDG
jgi:hypothetical protein